MWLAAAPVGFLGAGWRARVCLPGGYAAARALGTCPAPLPGVNSNSPVTFGTGQPAALQLQTIIGESGSTQMNFRPPSFHFFFNPVSIAPAAASPPAGRCAWGLLPFRPRRTVAAAVKLLQKIHSPGKCDGD